SSSFLQSSNTSSIEWAISQPSKLKFLFLVKIIFLRSGKALPIDSKFLLPKMMGYPFVVFLTYSQSFRILQGMSLSLPITLFLSIATIKEIFIYYTAFIYYFTKCFLSFNVYGRALLHLIYYFHLRLFCVLSYYIVRGVQRFPFLIISIHSQLRKLFFS